MSNDSQPPTEKKPKVSMRVKFTILKEVAEKIENDAREKDRRPGFIIGRALEKIYESGQQSS